MLTLSETQDLMKLVSMHMTPLKEVKQKLLSTFKTDARPKITFALVSFVEDVWCNMKAAESPSVIVDGVMEVLVSQFALFTLGREVQAETGNRILVADAFIGRFLRNLQSYIRICTPTHATPNEEQKDQVRLLTALKTALITMQFQNENWLEKSAGEYCNLTTQEINSEVEKMRSNTETKDRWGVMSKEIEATQEAEKSNFVGGFLYSSFPALLVNHDYTQPGSEKSLAHLLLEANIPYTPDRFRIPRPPAPPPPMPIESDDLVYLHSTGISSDLQFDLSVTELPELHVQLVLERAQTKEIPAQELATLKENMKELGLFEPEKEEGRRKLRLSTLLPPKSFPALIAKNKNIAADFLSALIQRCTQPIPYEATEYAPYLDSLSTTPTQPPEGSVEDLQAARFLPTLELVTKMAGQLPKQFILAYFSHTFLYVRTNQTGQGVGSHTIRHARVACQAVAKVLKEKVLTKSDLFDTTKVGVEAMSFCTDFIKHGEEPHRLFTILTELKGES